MDLVKVYVAVGFIVTALIVIIGDRRGTNPNAAIALLAGLLWPVIAVGGAQLALWAAAVKVQAPKVRLDR